MNKVSPEDDHDDAKKGTPPAGEEAKKGTDDAKKDTDVGKKGTPSGDHSTKGN
jgi:hypothetical protein